MEPIFKTQTQAIETMFTMLAHLSRLVLWLLIALLHLGLLVLALVACWWLGLTPKDLTEAYLRMQASLPASVLSFLGVSALTVLAAWLWALKKLQAGAGANWISAYLIRGL